MAILKNNKMQIELQKSRKKKGAISGKNKEYLCYWESIHPYVLSQKTGLLRFLVIDALVKPININHGQLHLFN